MEAWKGLGVKGSIVLDDVSFREAEAPSLPTTSSTTTPTVATMMTTTTKKKDASSIYTGFPCAMDRDPGPCRKNMSRFFYNYRQVFVLEASRVRTDTQVCGSANQNQGY